MIRLTTIALAALTACGLQPEHYQRTTLQLPAGTDQYKSNEHVDTLAQALIPSTNPVPPSVLKAVKSVMLARTQAPAGRLRVFRKATYHINDSITAFLIQAVVNQQHRYVDCIGLYKRNGNFDFYTNLINVGSRAPHNISLSTDISQFNGTAREYQVTYISQVVYHDEGKVKTHDRISFKDTLNQFLWYKLESGPYRPY